MTGVQTCALPISGSSAVAATAEIKDDAINWLQDVEQAKAVAAKSAKPIFIVFLRQDPVRALTAEFLKDAVVQKALADYVAVRVEEPEGRKIVTAYEVIMTGFVILNSKGQELVRSDAPPYKQQVLYLFDYAGALLRLEADKADVDALFTRGRYAGYFAEPEKALIKIETGLKALPEDDVLRRARLLFCKGVLSMQAGAATDDASDLVQRARMLDADNKAAVREDADFLLLMSAHVKSGNDAELRDAINLYLKQYPAETIRDEGVRYRILNTQFILQMQAKDFDGALNNLQTQKKFATGAVVRQLQDEIEAVKAEMASMKDEGAGNDGPGVPRKRLLP